MRRVFSLLLLFLLSCFTATQTLYAQGFLVNESASPAMMPRPRIWPGPRPPHIPPSPRPVPIQTYKIQELSVDGIIRDQVAEINVSQTFKNTGSTQMEVSFVFPLPYDGAIDQMTLMVDGKEYPAKLLDATAARKTYEDIVRRNRDPALLEWIGTGMFKTNVFPVPAGATRTVTIRYTQLLKKDNGVCNFLFPLSAAKYTAEPVEKLVISLTLESQEELKNIYCPTHETKEKRLDAKKAIVSLEEKNIVPSSDLRLIFDSGSGELSTKILSYRPNEKEDGFFLLLATPQFVDRSKSESETKSIPKTVLFVLDKSGSMMGEKIAQARDALKFVLNNLNENDTFNIITYDSRVETFRPEIMAYTPENRKAAIDFCDSIRASGSTNISGALTVSLKMLQDKNQPNYVLFLTDGLPNVGESREMPLVEISKNANQTGARIFSFGVGFDVNARLLDRISEENRGQTEFVLPNENIEDRVSRLYNKISDPVLSDVSFEISTKSGEETNKSGTNQVYPNRIFDIFAGEQLVILGRYSKSGKATVEMKGKVGEESKAFTFEGDFVQKSDAQNYSFIERLWAMRRIGEILSEIDLKGQNQELLDELVKLSTKHGILTPYTSFLADENTVLTDTSRNRAYAVERLDALQITTGASGVAQRGSNQEMRSSSKLALGQNRYDAAAPASPAYSGGMGGMGMSGGGQAMGGGGMGGGARGRAARGRAAMPRRQGLSAGPGAAPASPQAPAMGITTGITVNTTESLGQVQNINNRAFFQKGNVWIDSTLTEAQQKPENVITVKQFSDEYFKLIEKHGKELSQYLAFDETVMLNFDGKTYRFEQE